VTGLSGNAPVNADANIRVNFHSGDAANNEDTLETCDVFGQNCYFAKSLAVIDLQ